MKHAALSTVMANENYAIPCSYVFQNDNVSTNGQRIWNSNERKGSVWMNGVKKQELKDLLLLPFEACSGTSVPCHRTDATGR